MSYVERGLIICSLEMRMAYYCLFGSIGSCRGHTKCKPGSRADLVMLTPLLYNWVLHVCRLDISLKLQTAAQFS